MGHGQETSEILRGRAWAIYESLGETDNASYDALKKAIISRLNPDTDEDRLAARKQLTHRRLLEGIESLDELVRDIVRSIIPWTSCRDPRLRAEIPFNEHPT